MSPIATIRVRILVLIWLLVAFHSCVCEVALAQVAPPSILNCCGGPKPLPTSRTDLPLDRPCCDCPVCAPANSPEELTAETPVVIPILGPRDSAFIARVDPTTESILAAFQMSDTEPPARVCVHSLDSCPNAPPNV